MLPPTTLEQRTPFYQEVEQLLTPGFLTQAISLGDVRLSLRSLGPGDLFMLKERSQGGTAEEWQQWAVATSIWMVNGYNLLDQSHAPVRMYDMVRALPDAVFDMLFTNVLALFSRSNKAYEDFEAYKNELQSRYLWRMYSKGDMHLHSGVEGAGKLGTNYIQRLWIAHNVNEDLTFKQEASWNGFKLVASSNAPEAIRKIDDRDSQRRHEDEERRKGVLDRFYYYRIGVIDKEGYLKSANMTPSGVRITSAKSPDELAGEFRNWTAGVDDDHDRVIQEYKDHVLKIRAQKRREIAERRQMVVTEALQREKRGEDVGRIRAYTPEQLQKVLRGRGPGRRSGAWLPDESVYGHQSYLEKHLDKPIEQGETTPLQAAVAGRRPGFGAGSTAATGQRVNMDDPRARAYAAQQAEYAKMADGPVNIDPSAFGIPARRDD